MGSNPLPRASFQEIRTRLDGSHHREGWRRVIYPAQMRRVLRKDQPMTSSFYFSINIDGGNLPRDYSSTINIKIKLISNLIDKWLAMLTSEHPVNLAMLLIV